MIKSILFVVLTWSVFAVQSNEELRKYLLPVLQSYNSLRRIQHGKFGTLQTSTCTAYEYATLNTTGLSTFCSGTCAKWLTDNSLKDLQECNRNPKLAKCTEFVKSCDTINTIFMSDSCSSYSSKTTCCADTKCKWEAPDTSPDADTVTPSFFQFLCLKQSDNSFCLPNLLQADGNGECSTSNSDISTKLDKLCGGCLQGIMQINQDPTAARQIKLMCTKDQGKYCFADIASIDYDDIIKTPSKLRSACAAACPPSLVVTQAAQFLYANITKPADQTAYDRLAQIGQFICSKENGNSYCFADIVDFAITVNNCTCSVDCCGACTFSTCPAGCNKTGNVCDYNTTVGCQKLQNLVNNIGTCCLGAFSELVGLNSDLKSELEICGIKGFTGKCTATTKVAKSVKINGKCDLFNSNKDAYTKAITRDLETTIGCIGCIKDVAFTCATSSSKMNTLADQTQVNFNIQGATNAQNTQLSAKADSAIASGITPAETVALVNKDTKSVTTSSPSPSPSQNTTNSTFKSSANVVGYQSSILFIIPTLYSLFFL